MERRIPQQPPKWTLVAFETGGNIVKPRGETIERGRDAALERIERCLACRRLGTGKRLAGAAQLVVRLGKLIGDQETDHHEKARFADHTDRAVELGGALVEIGGEPDDLLFLSVVARDRIAPATNGDGDLTHAQPPISERTSAIAWVSRFATASLTTLAAA